MATTTASAAPAAASDYELTSVHINLPRVMWQAVEGLARRFSTSKTNIVVRALNKEAYFARVLDQDPGATVWVEHTNGERERVVFI